MQDSRDASHCLNTIQVAQVRMVCTQGKLKASFCCLHISDFLTRHGWVLFHVPGRAYTKPAPTCNTGNRRTSDAICCHQ